MDWDKFWREQLLKNKSGTPKYSVWTDPDTPEDEFMGAWIIKWQEQFPYFDNGGCGCCVNLFDFEAPAEAIAELPKSWVMPYEDPTKGGRSGNVASFADEARSPSK